MKKIQTRLMPLLVCLSMIMGFSPVSVFAVTPEVTFGDAWRNTRTEAQVEFTSQATGEYYYAVTDPSVTMDQPAIDTSVAGIPCTANEKVTVTVENVPTTSPCIFWLIVKGEDGTTSDVSITTIPEWDWWTLGDDGILHIETDKGLTNWKNWLNAQDLFDQMWYRSFISEICLWKDVTKVDGGSFPASEYSKVTAYTVQEGNTAFSVDNGILYNYGKSTLVAYPGGKKDTAYTAPDTVQFIDYKAFYGNTNLKNVKAGQLVNILSSAFAGSAIETFSAEDLKRISDRSFYSCKNLTTVTITADTSFYIDMNAFENCSSLTTFPFEKIDETSHSVFKGCTSLTKIQVPKRIESSIFAGCTGLTEITIPADVTYIGGSAFDGCNNLASVTFESATPPEIAGTGTSAPFKPVAANFRFHVPEGSEEAYIQALGEDMAPYILDSDILFYPLYVNGDRFRSDKLEIPCGNGLAAFDPDTNTLTLKNAQITQYGGKYGYMGAINSGLTDLTIVVIGDNTIDTEGDSINTAMECNLLIKGDGTLTTNKQFDLGREPSIAYDGSQITGDLTIDGTTVNIGGYLWVHHDLTVKNGAQVYVSGGITTNNQSTFTIDDADSAVNANSLSMGNNRSECESQFILNDGKLTLRDGVAYPNPSDGDKEKYSIHFDPKENGKIILNGGTFITESACKVTNALDENITIASTLDINQGSWENGNLEIGQKKHVHNLVFVPENPATCTTDGTKAYYTCSECGKFFEDEKGLIEIKDLDSWKIIPAGHKPASSWDSDDEYHWKTCTVPGCGEIIDGTKEHHTSTGANIATCQHKAICDVCHKEYGDLADHDPSSSWSSDENGHWNACQTAGCSEKCNYAAHTPDHEGHATEEYAIKCSVCHYVIEPQLAHTHMFDQEIATDAYKATDATCLAKATYYKSCACGQKGTETFEYGDLGDHNWKPATCTAPQTCAVCGMTEGTALGHNEGTEWKADAQYHWHICTNANCGIVMEDSKTAHEFKWVIDKEATAGEKGSKHEECTICGYKKAAVEIPAIGVSAEPVEPGKTENTGTVTTQTGDTSNLVLWVAVIFVSGCSLGTLVLRKRYKAAKSQ